MPNHSGDAPQGRIPGLLRARWYLLAAAFCTIVAATAADAFAQPVPSLRVAGEVPTPLSLSAADIAALPRTKLGVADDSGAKAVYEGTPVVEILRRAGAPLGKDLRGPKMTLCVVAGASDGYHVVFALAEFDPSFTDRTIILADRRNGQPLNAREGPFRIIVPGEKRHGRWIRGVTTLTVLNAK
ncbi:MAG: molybdopterin-dependent oxidoreductase [Candidatus Binataceae bacterium]